MLSCWNEDVTKRPSFKHLQTTLDRLLAAKSSNTYIDFSINPENLCYQVADEEGPSTRNNFLNAETRASKRRSRMSNRPASNASSNVSPSPSGTCLEEISPPQPGATHRGARTPSPTMEKMLASKSLDVAEGSRRPRSMMLLQSNTATTTADDDRWG